MRVGQIVGTFGLKGQLKVQPLTEFLERFEVGSRLLLKDEWIEVVGMSIHKGRPLLKLKGITNINTAEALKWEYLEAVGRPELDEDEFLAEDLVGLDVFTEEGEPLGKIEKVMPYPAHDLLVVGEIMIPMVKEFVRKIDVTAGRISVHLIPGMRGEE